MFGLMGTEQLIQQQLIVPLGIASAPLATTARLVDLPEVDKVKTPARFTVRHAPHEPS